MSVLFFTSFAVVVFCCVSTALLASRRGASDAERRLEGVLFRAERERMRGSKRNESKRKLLAVVKSSRMRIGFKEDELLKRRLSGAGIKRAAGTDAYLGARMICPVAGLIGGSLVPGNAFFCALLLGAVGYLGPDMWLRRRIKKRREAIRRGIPDVLDILVICLEAGVGLDQALFRVAKEVDHSYPALNQELVQVTLEQNAGKPRLEAWQSLADRTEIEEFQSFVNMFTQTDRFGTPIVRALSRFSEELRMKRRQKAEELAAKTKIKILFPLVLFIFPCIFIVLLAPAILTMGKALGSLQH